MQWSKRVGVVESESESGPEKFRAGGVGVWKNVSTPTPGFLYFCFQQKVFSSLMEIDKMLFFDMKTVRYMKWGLR